MEYLPKENGLAPISCFNFRGLVAAQSFSGPPRGSNGKVRRLVPNLHTSHNAERHLVTGLVLVPSSASGEHAPKVVGRNFLGGKIVKVVDLCGIPIHLLSRADFLLEANPLRDLIAEYFVAPGPDFGSVGLGNRKASHAGSRANR